MHSRHKGQEATFVEFLLQGKYHAKDFCFWGSFSYLFFVKELVFSESVLLKIATIQELYIAEGYLFSKKG